MNLVGVRDVVGFSDFAVVIGGTVEELAYLGQVVAGRDGIGLLGRPRGGDLVMEVGVGWVDLLDGVPNAVGKDGGWNGAPEQELVAIERGRLKLGALRGKVLKKLEDGCVLLRELCEIGGHGYSVMLLGIELKDVGKEALRETGEAAAFVGLRWQRAGTLRKVGHE